MASPQGIPGGGRKVGRQEGRKEACSPRERSALSSEERVSIKNGRPVHGTAATSQIQFNINGY